MEFDVIGEIQWVETIAPDPAAYMSLKDSTEFTEKLTGKSAKAWLKSN